MAITTLAAFTSTTIQRRQQRIFQCYYFCDACDSEWSEEMLSAISARLTAIEGKLEGEP